VLDDVERGDERKRRIAKRQAAEIADDGTGAAPAKCDDRGQARVDERRPSSAGAPQAGADLETGRASSRAGSTTGQVLKRSGVIRRASRQSRS